MEIKKGIGVSPGVAISTALVLHAEDLLIPERHIGEDQVPEELHRLDEAIGRCMADLTTLRESIKAAHAPEVGNILDFHVAILHDKSVLLQMHQEIATHKSTSEFAVSTVMRRYANTFEKMTDVLHGRARQGRARH